MRTVCGRAGKLKTFQHTAAQKHSSTHTHAHLASASHEAHPAHTRALSQDLGTEHQAVVRTRAGRRRAGSSLLLLQLRAAVCVLCCTYEKLVQESGGKGPEKEFN